MYVFAACRCWHALEAISNSRHKSVYMHNFCFVLWRQIELAGDLTPFFLTSSPSSLTLACTDHTPPLQVICGSLRRALSNSVVLASPVRR